MTHCNRSLNAGGCRVSQWRKAGITIAPARPGRSGDSGRGAPTPRELSFAWAAPTQGTDAAAVDLSGEPQGQASNRRGQLAARNAVRAQGPPLSRRALPFTWAGTTRRSSPFPGADCAIIGGPSFTGRSARPTCHQRRYLFAMGSIRPKSMGPMPRRRFLPRIHS